MRRIWTHLNRDERGFTLVELLLVVAILAVLALLAIPRIADTIKTGRERTCDSNVLIIEEAVNRFHADEVAKGTQEEVSLWPGVANLGDASVDLTTGTAWVGTMDAGFLAYFNSVPVCPFNPASGSTQHVYRVTYTWDSTTTHVTGFAVTCSGEDTVTGEH